MIHPTLEFNQKDILIQKWGRHFRIKVKYYILEAFTGIIHTVSETLGQYLESNSGFPTSTSIGNQFKPTKLPYGYYSCQG